MKHFQNALQLTLDRKFGGKLAALTQTSGLHSTDIGRLLRDEAPLTAEKLTKILTAEGMSQQDQQLLSQSAVRDFVGEDAYRAWFITPQPENVLREQLGGPAFQSLSPMSPRAEQVLRWLVSRAGHDSDVSTALELLGKFLELPPPREPEFDPKTLPPRREVKYSKKSPFPPGHAKAASPHQETP